MAATTTGVEAMATKVLKAAVDFQKTAEKFPNSGPRLISQLELDLLPT